MTDRDDLEDRLAGRADDALAQLAAQPLPVPLALGGPLEAELGRLAPTHARRPLRQLAILVGASLIYGVGLLSLLTVRRDASGLPPAWIVGAAAAWLLGFVVPCYLALVPRAGAMMPRLHWAAASAAVTAIAFVALGLVVHPSVPGVSLDYGWARLVHGHWCLWLGLATSVVPVALGAIALRGAVPAGARWIAAALGAGGGCLGGLLLHFHCPIADGPHIGLIHGGVVGVAALLAAWIVPAASDRPFAK